MPDQTSLLPTFLLREMRERAGMSVEELARLTGLTVDQIAWHEHYKKGFDWDSCTNIAVALGCTLDELAGIAPDTVASVREDLDQVLAVLEAREEIQP